jgi:hypothetical protein
MIAPKSRGASPTPIPFDEEEARAMARAMRTGELPSTSVPCYERVRRLANLYWVARNTTNRAQGCDHTYGARRR